VDRVSLARLDSLCDEGNRVVRLDEIHDGDHNEFTIGMRHDCDDRAFGSMLALADWEYRRGRRSTFYVLHTAPWYANRSTVNVLRAIADLGHEIGLHLNWVPDHERYGVSARDVLGVELGKLRNLGFEVRSVAGHGDDACYRTKLVNYSCFAEAGPMRAPWRQYEETGYTSLTLDEFGIDFLGEFVKKGKYVSDSGDEWSIPLSTVQEEFPYGAPLVILQHPDWYDARLFA
jgi:hypothetical protein